MRDVEVTAPGKLLALLIVIVGCIAFIIAAVFVKGTDTTPAWATLTLVVGYLVGNGAGARKGITTAAPFAPKEEPEPVPVQTEPPVDKT